MEQAIFLNGVYESVLQEILDAQEHHADMVFYMQPYKSKAIGFLKTASPSRNNPISLYISTTKNLDHVCYIADCHRAVQKQPLVGSSKPATLVDG